MTFLETHRLLFRTHEPQDEESFVQMQTDPEVRKYVGGQAWPMEKALYRFRNQYLGQPTDTYGLWATILKAQSRYIGCCGLRASEDGVHLAFYLARAYWGRGLASEASRAFIEIAFGRLGLQRILADVDCRNEVSKHILEKFGFRYISEELIAVSGRTIYLYELSIDGPSLSSRHSNDIGARSLDDPSR